MSSYVGGRGGLNGPLTGSSSPQINISASNLVESLASDKIDSNSNAECSRSGAVECIKIAKKSNPNPSLSLGASPREAPRLCRTFSEGPMRHPAEEIVDSPVRKVESCDQISSQTTDNSHGLMESNCATRNIGIGDLKITKNSRKSDNPLGVDESKNLSVDKHCTKSEKIDIRHSGSSDLLDKIESVSIQSMKSCPDSARDRRKGYVSSSSVDCQTLKTDGSNQSQHSAASSEGMTSGSSMAQSWSEDTDVSVSRMSLIESSDDLLDLVEDREIAARAVAFVVSSSRKGIVPLCADVASLMRNNRRLEKCISRLRREVDLLRRESSSRATDICITDDVSRQGSSLVSNSVTNSLSSVYSGLCRDSAALSCGKPLSEVVKTGHGCGSDVLVGGERVKGDVEGRRREGSYTDPDHMHVFNELERYSKRTSQKGGPAVKPSSQQQKISCERLQSDSSGCSCSNDDSPPRSDASNPSCSSISLSSVVMLDNSHTPINRSIVESSCHTPTNRSSGETQRHSVTAKDDNFSNDASKVGKNKISGSNSRKSGCNTLDDISADVGKHTTSASHVAEVEAVSAYVNKHTITSPNTKSTSPLSNHQLSSLPTSSYKTSTTRIGRASMSYPADPGISSSVRLTDLNASRQLQVSAVIHQSAVQDDATLGRSKIVSAANGSGRAEVINPSSDNNRTEVKNPGNGRTEVTSPSGTGPTSRGGKIVEALRKSHLLKKSTSRVTEVPTSTSAAVQGREIPKDIYRPLNAGDPGESCRTLQTSGAIGESRTLNGSGAEFGIGMVDRKRIEGGMESGSAVCKSKSEPVLDADCVSSPEVNHPRSSPRGSQCLMDSKISCLGFKSAKSRESVLDSQGNTRGGKSTTSRLPETKSGRVPSATSRSTTVSRDKLVDTRGPRYCGRAGEVGCATTTSASKGLCGASVTGNNKKKEEQKSGVRTSSEELARISVGKTKVPRGNSEFVRARGARVLAELEGSGPVRVGSGDVRRGDKPQARPLHRSKAVHKGEVLMDVSLESESSAL